VVMVIAVYRKKETLLATWDSEITWNSLKFMDDFHPLVCCSL
jgi:hypothetical protein